MKYIRLESPVLRQKELNFEAFSYNIKKKLYLAPPSELRSKSFWRVFASRQTRRVFKSLGKKQLSMLLWYSSKTSSCKRLRSGYLWQHRPTPSGGGRHPIDIIVCNYKRGFDSLELYDPISHSLGILDIEHPTIVEKLIAQLTRIIPFDEATIILFAAQFQKTMASYKNGESLVWRDSGALLATIYFVSEAMNLNCCGIGITTEPFLSEALGSKDLVLGTGGCLVGKRI